MAQQRRRGKELENDILASTLALIETTKYEDLTMDMIAKNAHTNKTVLYRRWSSKAEIVMAAFRTQAPVAKFEQPHTGDLRTDLVALFDSIANMLDQFHVDNLGGLIQERFGMFTFRDYFVKLSGRDYLTQMMEKILAEAGARGEVNLAKITPEMYSLPIFMIMHMIFNDGLNQASLQHLVNDILMPVYKRMQNPAGETEA